MELSRLLYSELNILCIVIFLLLSHKLRRADKSIEQSYLIGLLIGESILFLLDTFWIIIDADPRYPSVLNYIVNLLYYTASAICPYICIKFLYLSLGGKLFSRKARVLLCLPAVAIFLLCLASFRTGWAFSVDASNTYHRGPLYIAAFLIPMGFVIANSALALSYALRSKQRYPRKKAFQLSFIMILPLFGEILEVLIPDITIVCAFITISMVSVIFDFQQLQITRDPLTQLSNRRDLMTYLEEVFSDKTRLQRKPVYVLYADIDYFKSINDTYGHLEGDHALCYVADAMRVVCRRHDAFPARIGGDEFVVVFSASNDATAAEFRQSLKDAVRLSAENLPYQLVISAGMTRCTEADRDDIPAMLERADSELYQEKQKRPKRR
ncbi:MAG: GGDEF domain-containing protein [Oscillospiraceae bacterium]|nr:GGDEF domain-containing protein [Oscillospiraceae bacterium]